MRKSPGPYLRAVHEAGKIEIDGQLVCTAPHKVLPLRMFVCPLCGRDWYRLHQVGGVWACRTCHALRYTSRHCNRTIRLNRLRFLRRRIGADLTPFTPLPSKLLSARGHWRIAQEIRQLEQALLEHTRCDVAEVLERRHATRS